MIEITLPWPPATGNHQYMARGHMRIVTPEIKSYRAQVRSDILRQDAAKRLEGPLGVTMDLYPPDRRRRDADNLLKVVGDALTLAGTWVDDSNDVIRWTMVRWHDPADKGGKIVVAIQEAL